MMLELKERDVKMLVEFISGAAHGSRERGLEDEAEELERVEGELRAALREVCDHVPDWGTIRPADGAPGIVDVECRQCYRSGSTRIEEEDIQW